MQVSDRGSWGSLLPGGGRRSPVRPSASLLIKEVQLESGRGYQKAFLLFVVLYRAEEREIRCLIHLPVTRAHAHASSREREKERGPCGGRREPRREPPINRLECSDAIICSPGKWLGLTSYSTQPQCYVNRERNKNNSQSANSALCIDPSNLLPSR